MTRSARVCRRAASALEVTARYLDDTPHVKCPFCDVVDEPSTVRAHITASQSGAHDGKYGPDYVDL